MVAAAKALLLAVAAKKLLNATKAAAFAAKLA